MANPQELAYLQHVRKEVAARLQSARNQGEKLKSYLRSISGDRVPDELREIINTHTNTLVRELARYTSDLQQKFDALGREIDEIIRMQKNARR